MEHIERAPHENDEIISICYHSNVAEVDASARHNGQHLKLRFAIDLSNTTTKAGVFRWYCGEVSISLSLLLSLDSNVSMTSVLTLIQTLWITSPLINTNTSSLDYTFYHNMAFWIFPSPAMGSRRRVRHRQRESKKPHKKTKEHFMCPVFRRFSTVHLQQRTRSVFTATTDDPTIWNSKTTVRGSSRLFSTNPDRNWNWKAFISVISLQNYRVSDNKVIAAEKAPVNATHKKAQANLLFSISLPSEKSPMKIVFLIRLYLSVFDSKMLALRYFHQFPARNLFLRLTEKGLFKKMPVACVDPSSIRYVIHIYLLCILYIHTWTSAPISAIVVIMIKLNTFTYSKYAKREIEKITTDGKL